MAKQTAAQKRGLGAGWAEHLDMQEAYLPHVLETQRRHTCKIDGELAIPCLGPVECNCQCHETWKLAHVFTL